MDCKHTLLELQTDNGECGTYQCVHCGATVGVDMSEFEGEFPTTDD
jgi:hypothetical protein